VNIQNVHVSDLRANLLSVEKMTDKGLKIVFEKNRVRVIDECGNEALSADRINGLYYLRKTELEESKNTEFRQTMRGSRKRTCGIGR